MNGVRSVKRPPSVLAALLVCGASAGAFPAAVWTDAPGNVAVEGEAVAIHDGAPGAAWLLLDWCGQDTGVSGVFDERGEAPLPPLPTGYYQLLAHAGESSEPSGIASSIPLVTRHSSLVTGEGGEIPFATLAVVQPPESRTVSRGRYFAADSGFSWVASPDGRLKGQRWFDGDAYRLVAHLMRLAGVEATRDRLSWTRVQSAHGGEVDWKEYGRAAEVLKEFGIPDSECYHDAPAWTKRIQKLPSDLAAVFSFSRRAAEDLGGTMDAWEFWNEPDIHSAPEPVWEYAVAQKAASLGFRAAGGKGVVQSSALTGGGSVYSRAAFESDLAKYVDVYNFHCYEELNKLPLLQTGWQRFLRENDLDGMAIWITECNEPFTVRPPEESEPGVSEARRLSPVQELVQAEVLPKMMLSHLCGGVARAYWFIFPAFNNRNADWGLMRRDGTVRPAYAAYATMTALLSPLEMLGEARLDPGFKGYVFRALDERRTLAFWSASEADAGKVTPSNTDPLRRELVLDAPDGEYHVTGLCGETRIVRAEGGKLRLVATRFPAYVGGVGEIPIGRPALAPGQPKRYEPSTGEDLSVVVRVELDGRDYRLAEGKTLAEMEGDVLRARLHVWNLSDAQKRCILALEGGTLRGAEDPVDVPPMAERILRETAVRRNGGRAEDVRARRPGADDWANDG